MLARSGHNGKGQAGTSEAAMALHLEEMNSLRVRIHMHASTSLLSKLQQELQQLCW